MHSTILALGSTGDILPYTALGKGLKDAGYQVRFITFEGFKSTVQKLGLDFHPIAGDPRLLVAGGGTNVFTMAKSFGSLRREYTNALSAPHLLETDLLINQLPGGLFGVDLAEKAGIPLIQAAVIPLTPTKEFPMMGFPEITVPGYNKKSFQIAESIVWKMFKKVINNWRVQELGLAPISRKEYFYHGDLIKPITLYGFSPTVVNRPLDWGEENHITGYWFPSDLDWRPPPALEKFIVDGSPPVFIGFGSMPIKNQTRITQTILEVLNITNQRAILHSGWGGLGKQDLPENIFKIDYAPYDWLFPRMAMVIHHGGSGTTGFALKAGIPSCAVPIGFDQVYWGKRIYSLGVGPEPIRLQKLSAAGLANAIQRGINDLDVRKNAANVGQKIRSEDGIKTAVTVIKELYYSMTIGKINGVQEL